MNENSLMQFLMQMSQRGDSEMGEGDYKDFLANYMNAMNRGADDSQIQSMLEAFSPQRKQAMSDYAGGPALEKDPHIRDARGSLNRLLSK